MNNYEEIIATNALFKHLTASEFKILLEPDACIIGHYKKNTIIMQEGDVCVSIGFIIEGSLSVQQLSPSGELMDIQIFHTGDCFGPALMYASQPIYPYTLMTLTKTRILYIPFSRIDALLNSNPAFCKEYIIFLSNRVNAFQQKIRLLSQKDVRSRLILYFSGIFDFSKGTTFQLLHTKTEIAELLGVARPSLSRELKKMQLDGLLLVNHNIITILKPELFYFI